MTYCQANKNMGYYSILESGSYSASPLSTQTQQKFVQLTCRPVKFKKITEPLSDSLQHSRWRFFFFNVYPTKLLGPKLHQSHKLSFCCVLTKLSKNSSTYYYFDTLIQLVFTEKKCVHVHIFKKTTTFL